MLTMPRTRVGRGAGAGLFAVIVAFGLVSVWLASRPPVIALGADSPQTLALLLARASRSGRRAASRSWSTRGSRSARWSSPPRSPGSPRRGRVPESGSTCCSPSASCWPRDGAPCRTRDPRLRRAPAGATRWVVGAGYLACVLFLGLVPSVTGTRREPAVARCPTNLLAARGRGGCRPRCEPGRPRARNGLGADGRRRDWLASLPRVRRHAPTDRARGPAGSRGDRRLRPRCGEERLPRVDRGRPFDTAAWAVQAVALIALAAGSCRRIARGRRTRSAVAEVVLELARGTEAGRLQERLRVLLGDPQLVLAYPAGDGRLVGASGAAACCPAVRTGARRRSSATGRSSR